MLASLIVLTAMIGAYGWLTDPDRLRGMAESYLSELIGGRVRVGQATLTIFEGLRLSRITVWVSDPKAPDAVLLVADDFNIEYDPTELLRGKLTAMRIIATSPKVKLVENVDTGSWNYQRLRRTKERSPTEPGEALPEIVLRDAEVQYSEIHNGRFAPCTQDHGDRGAAAAVAGFFAVCVYDAEPGKRGGGWAGGFGAGASGERGD